MGLNDFVRIINQGGRIRIELRSDPNAEEPTLTLNEGYITLGGPPADPASIEQGAMYLDPATGEIKHRGTLVPVP